MPQFMAAPLKNEDIQVLVADHFSDLALTAQKIKYWHVTFNTSKTKLV